MTPQPDPDLISLPWHTHAESSRGLGIVYTEIDGANVLIGMMGSPEMAAETCVLHNERLAVRLAKPPLA